MVQVYLPFQGAYDVMRERDFIALPLASANVLVRARSMARCIKLRRSHPMASCR